MRDRFDRIRSFKTNFQMDLEIILDKYISQKFNHKIRSRHQATYSLFIFIVARSFTWSIE